MKRIFVCATALLFGAASVAMAQDTAGTVGAGSVEIGLTPAGGTFFSTGSDNGADFGTYAIGANVTWNANRFVGIEFELGGGVGVNQTIDYRNGSFPDLRSPNTVAYNVNLTLYPGGKDQSLVPYVALGGGGMTIFSRDELNAVDLTSNQTFPSENVGVGIKWWSHNNWGLRGDYRFIVVNGRDSVDPFFGLNDTRYGNRISGSVLYTFDRY